MNLLSLFKIKWQVVIRSSNQSFFFFDLTIDLKSIWFTMIIICQGYHYLYWKVYPNLINIRTLQNLNSIDQKKKLISPVTVGQVVNTPIKQNVNNAQTLPVDTHTLNVAPFSLLFTSILYLCGFVCLPSKSCSEIYSNFRFIAEFGKYCLHSNCNIE